MNIYKFRQLSVLMKKEDLLKSLKERGIPENIIEAFSEIDRADFVPHQVEKMAYEDIPLPTMKDQTTSQPYTIALMLSLLDIKKGQKVLEIGSGSGYALALISHIVGEKGRVFGVELINELAKKSRRTLSEFKNIKVFHRNGSNGLPEFVPFDRILISAALRDTPERIFSQLTKRGIIVFPKGSRFEHELNVIQRKSESEFEVLKKVPGFIFVPFIYDDSQ